MIQLYAFRWVPPLAQGLVRDFRVRWALEEAGMTTVLRILRHTSLVAERPVLKAYQERCEARPTFRKALADHLRPFAAAAT